MADYFASLRKLLPRQETLYIPTHGAEIRDPVPFVGAYIQHRQNREAQILARLKDGPKTIPEMVALNYADTPRHLHAAAGPLDAGASHPDGEGRAGEDRRRPRDAEQPLPALSPRRSDLEAQPSGISKGCLQTNRRRQHGLVR